MGGGVGVGWGMGDGVGWGGCKNGTWHRHRRPGQPIDFEIRHRDPALGCDCDAEEGGRGREREEGREGGARGEGVKRKRIVLEASRLVDCLDVGNVPPLPSLPGLMMTVNIWEG